MARFLVHLLFSLVPDPYRRRWSRGLADYRGYAIGAGLAQLVTCVGLLIYGYLQFLPNRLASVSSANERVMEKGGESFVMGFGVVWLADYLIHPLSLALVFFAIEGLVRFVAALALNDVVSTFPLWLVMIICTGIGRRFSEVSMGPRVADEVEPTRVEGCDLRISSCRPKPEWDHLLTVVYGGEMYEVARQGRYGDRPREFVYMLRKKPAHKVVRGIYYYDPLEPLSWVGKKVTRKN